MPVAQKVEAACPQCGGDDEVWRHEKWEPTVAKEQYTCEACGCEWTEIGRE